MATDQLPICNYPRGGLATTAGGDGIFLDPSGEPIRIWVDYMLKNGRTIIKTAQNEMAEAASFHNEPETQLLILHPSSFRLFDSYCHPDWLSGKRRRAYDKYMEENGDEVEDWTRKVLLKEGWIWRCVEAGRFLGESDGWAGCRVGGPPKGQVLDIKVDLDPPTLNNDVKPQLPVEDVIMEQPISEDVVMEEPTVIIKDIIPEPDFVAPPTPISMPAVIHVEPPTPADPLDQRPVTNSQTVVDEADDLESIFGDKDRSPSPPIPVRRSTRSRSATTKDGEGFETRLRSNSAIRLKSRKRSYLSESSEESDDEFKSTLASGFKRVPRSGTRVSYEDDFARLGSEDLSEIKPRSRRARHNPPSESSEEEALASKRASKRTSPAGSTAAKANTVQKGKGRSAPISIMGQDDLDIAMLDSGPSSRFQSPPLAPQPAPAPPPPLAKDGKLFTGLIFWVDLGMKNRGDLLKEIKTAGGKISAEYADATHVLVHKYAQQADQWKEPIAEHARSGIWFLGVEWAKKSLVEKKKLPELDYVLPGGASAKNALSNDVDFSTEDVTSVLEKAHVAAIKDDLNVQDVAKLIKAEHIGPVKDWVELYTAWKRRTGIFGHLPPLAVPSTKSSAFAPLEETALTIKAEPSGSTPIKARLDRAGLEAIFAKESWRLERICSGKIRDFTTFLSGKYGVYTPGSWANYYNDWNNGRGKWANGARTFQGAGLTVDELREGPIANVVTPRKDTVALPVPSTRIPLATMASALTSYFKHSGDKLVINASLGEHMEALYPAYTARSWENMARGWKDGSGRFARHGPRWHGVLDAVDGDNGLNDQSQAGADEPVVPMAAVKRYTEDEELAMGQFVLHQESNGDFVTGGSWAIFAEVYPYRTKAAWAEHYRAFKDRILHTVNKHQTAEEADAEPEPVELVVKDEKSPSIASGSTPKPKKQKLVVSKKDYEDLAHFIVETLAEGDVPDTKDFEEFSRDHPHRNGPAWYTIWHRDRYRSTLLPLIEEYRRAATPNPSQARAKSSRPLPNAYTDEEERAMAEFIVRHVPPDRLPKAADWAKFQKNHTRRSAPSWTEHYRVYKPRITALVDEIKEAQPSIVRQSAGRAQNAIELGSEEEEEEEVEEIVPARTGRRSRNRDIIIIDED